MDHTASENAVHVLSCKILEVPGREHLVRRQDTPEMSEYKTLRYLWHKKVFKIISVLFQQ